MTHPFLGVLLWLVVRAVRARRGNGAAGAGSFLVPAMPIAAYPRAASSLVMTMAGVILFTDANGGAALPTFVGGRPRRS